MDMEQNESTEELKETAVKETEVKETAGKETTKDEAFGWGDVEEEMKASVGAVEKKRSVTSGSKK